MLIKVFIAFVLALAIVAILIVLRPATYHVERSTTIAAPPDKVFGMVNDFHSWDVWSPWAKIDPAMKLEIRDTTYEWSGNDKAGAGKMTRTESHPNDRIGVHLDFTKPYASTSDIAFVFKPVDAGTGVTWSMDGQNNFMLKALSLFSSMDKLVGPDFEKGLAQLKTAAEQAR